MPFTINFYKVTDPPNKLDKTTGTSLGSFNCSPFKPISDLTGSVVVSYTAEVEAANYAAIGTRYYYVRDVILQPGGRMEVVLELDPLKTLSTEIKACDCICATTCKKELHNTYAQNSDLKISQLTIHGTAIKADSGETLGLDKEGFIVGTYG